MTLLNSRTAKGPRIKDKTASGAGHANHRNTNSCAPFDTAPADECRPRTREHLAQHELEKLIEVRKRNHHGRRDALMRWGQPYSTTASSKRHCSRSSAGACGHAA